MWHNKRDSMEIKELDNSQGTKDYHINKGLSSQTKVHFNNQDLEDHLNSLKHRTLTRLPIKDNHLLTIFKRINMLIKDNHLHTILKLRINVLIKDHHQLIISNSLINQPSSSLNLLIIRKLLISQLTVLHPKETNLPSNIHLGLNKEFLLHKIS